MGASALSATVFTQVISTAASRLTAELPQHQVSSPTVSRSGTHGAWPARTSSRSPSPASPAAESQAAVPGEAARVEGGRQPHRAVRRQERLGQA